MNMQPNSQTEQSNMSEDDFWNDSDILNNPKKLIMLKFTEADFVAASLPNFCEKCDFVTELILQDCQSLIDGVIQKLEAHEVNKQSGQSGSQVLSNLDAKLQGEGHKCLQIIQTTKNKPFWTKDLLKSSVKKVDIEHWITSLDSFEKAFAQAKALRMSRKSQIPDSEIGEEDEIVNAIGKLAKIVEELGSLSKIFDE